MFREIRRSTSVSNSIVLLSTLLFILCALQPASAEVRWRSGAISDPAPMEQPALRDALTVLSGRPDRNRVVMHFDGPVSLDDRAALEAGGVRLLSYLGGYAYFAALTPTADARAASAVEGLVAVEAIDPLNKLHPDLAAGIVHPWAVVSPSSEAGGKAAPGGPTVAVYVLFHRDVDLGSEAPRVIGRHAGVIDSFVEAVNGAVVHVAASRVEAIAREDAVMYVEPPLPMLTEINDSNITRVEADLLQAPPYGLDGSGVDVLVYDGGKVAQHGDLAGRLTIGSTDTSGTSDHATHVACTVAGDGSGSSGQYTGMAPGADIVSFGFEQEGGLSEGFLYTDPGDLEADYGEAIATYGADLSNNSIGSNTAPNGFPCEWEGNYGTTGALIDEIARGFFGDPFRIVWSNGNERSSGRCGTTYLTTAPPACAKNHITIGALNSNNDSVTSFTSWGPCDDGRLKPDVSGPGCESGGDGGVTSCSSSGGYTVKCGTSMSGPTVAGVAALLLEQYRLSFPGEPDFRNSTLKAILAQTSVDLVTPGPDYQSGYGSVRATPAADLIIEERFIEAEVTQGETYTFLVLVGAEDDELKVTLAWDDPAGTPDVNPVLVNDLDLRVLDGGGTVYHPWTLDPANPADPAVRTQRDGTNNIEQVVIDAPTPGAYTVEIIGFNVAQGPTQSFSVAASPSLINCAPAGIVSTDAARISCEADLGIQVIDCDLNTDDGLVETVDVSVVSPSEPGGETVTLTETAAETAAFLGSIPVSTTDGPGVLQVTEFETITVTYVDADDGAGGVDVSVTKQVYVDCTAPSITDVTMTEVNPRDATVAIAADEPVRLTLDYGTSCGLLTGSAFGQGLNIAHSIKLTGLDDDTTYFFALEAEDEAGNTTVEDNGGACFQFTTPEIPEFFTEQFLSGIDLVGLSVTFSPNGTFDFYGACAEDLQGALPTDPADGTVLNLSDDQPGSFDLGDGATVSLYGQSHGTVFVGPNGYLTFGSGDSTYNESFSAHFSLPRVAAVYDDLNPSLGGTVSWKQLADRIAVTWDAVPEYSTSNSNTFQIEMFFDGRIRLSWLQLDSQDAIVGLSEGVGQSPDFFESDLSASGSCGPVPPTAHDVEVQTTIGDPVTVTLVATDDGLPEPANLTYRVSALPEFGVLSDPAAGASIVAVPFDLVGETVTFQPYPGYGGTDSFTYVADDGGVPPEGGESDVAIVTVEMVVGTPEVLFQFLADDVDPGWSTTGDWAFGPPTGGGSHDGDPASGATGANVYGYNLDGDYANRMREEYLTSQPLDLSNSTDTVIEFQRWLGVETSLRDHASFAASTDGVNWTTLWAHGGPSLSESAWSLQSYDVSAIADHQPSVSFRWVMGTTNDSVTYPGWNIDDVRVVGVVVPTCTDAPDEVVDVRFATEQTLEWWVGPAQLGSPPVYDTIRSSSSTDFESAVVCVESDGDDDKATDTDVPAAGMLYHYLVRAENDCGPGPLGGGRRGVDCKP